ncbi:unnamed protein product [Hermetia illucens]|uniref:Chitin-binding type-2 domain-containing protein n=1 Tax=Hermetia illucens TaxID=343691 RepID=A0A7R8UE00_HERIL|nr:uncharacterized protein LOC119646819 [Hermetia illucens]CAD7078187.1 unnamed protein product [Hermetia illucens]
MRINLFIITLAGFLLCLAQAQNKPSPFSQNYEEAEYETEAQTPVEYRTKLYNYEQEEETDDRTYRRESQLPNLKKSVGGGKKRPGEEEIEEEEEKPDRLTLLLEQSRFACDGKTTGYYADETLNCEVFHYCQDNQRHSWICPEGFTFHQVHLICMPPTGENICDQSSKYHIVNEYLYKPINVAEHETKPNVSLKYSERYYPENFYQDGRQDYEEEAPQQHYQRTPIQVGFNSAQRKVATPTPAPQISAAPYRFSTQPPQQQVYRSPEEINISLQQRRPQIYLASPTPKYTETDYGFEQ